MAHSAFRAAEKRDVARGELQQSVGDWTAAETGMAMEEWRAHAIQQVARRNIDAITPENCVRCIQIITKLAYSYLKLDFRDYIWCFS
ncbi:Hypothetical predicted protein [Octopus vulgaris]|uniref:Uncharacterized protein n=1 Tax=Octopus vulgaris TaxID=6645 RepID=A0AA36ARH1_OCTVU|nr:Hypothetical predicted protein [Octopus vulgaris]